MVMFHLAWLIFSLFLNSKTNATLFKFCISSELVSTKVEIQRCQWWQVCCPDGKDKKRPHNSAHLQTEGKRKYGENQQFANPAFGGQGTGPAINIKVGNKLRSQNWRHLHADGYTFNSTLDYPGEGWKRFNVATWNPRSLTEERFKYCQTLGHDVLALTELWRHQSKFQS